MTVPEKLSALRAVMRAKGVDAYVVLTDDFHASEYVGDYFKAREYLSGFTGSAGTLVVLSDRAFLWTDGRYFLQAEEQLRDSGILLMRDREPGVPTVAQFLADTLPPHAVIGFDGRTVSKAFAVDLAAKTAGKEMKFAPDGDLVGEIWSDRPALSHEKVFELDAARVGATREEKLACVRRNLAQNHSDYLIVSALDEIAWLLNLRGGDVRCTPVFLSFFLLGQESATLFVQDGVISGDIAEKLHAAGVSLAPYGEVYREIAKLPAGARVQYDGRSANYRICGSIPADAVAVDAQSPIAYLKAVKTPAEAENLRVAHLKDGIALTRFLCWVKKRVGKEPITELSAAAKLEEFRREQPGFLGNSFDPIIAYGAHAAIVHYSPTEKTNAPLAPAGLCLADTGGHYEEGTTDVTRTFALGAVSDEEKHFFTLVLRGHLALAAARFKYGACGENLDILAREPLWAEGVDYNHGTGHGVGFLLSVHEGPHGFRWQISGTRPPVTLEEGMVVSDEPGFYLAGNFGIRHENLVLVRKGEKTEYGQFMYLEPLTLVPFDRDAIDKTLLSAQETAWLNAYHQRVCDALSPYLEGEELDFLKAATAPL